MEAVLQFIETTFPVIITHKYLFLFIGAMMEGMNTLILGGFLASVNSILLWPTFMLFILAYTINGYLWYAVGFFAGAKPIDRWAKKDEKRRKVVEKVGHYFSKYSGRAIIITKFTFSLTIATLITAGSLKYSFKKFTFYNFAGSIAWVVVTMFVGYFFGESYKLFSDYVKSLTIGLVFLVGAIAVVYMIKRTFGSAFIESLLSGDRIRDFSYKFRNGLEAFLSNGSDEEEKRG